MVNYLSNGPQPDETIVEELSSHFDFNTIDVDCFEFYSPNKVSLTPECHSEGGLDLPIWQAIQPKYSGQFKKIYSSMFKIEHLSNATNSSPIQLGMGEMDGNRVSKQEDS